MQQAKSRGGLRDVFVGENASYKDGLVKEDTWFGVQSFFNVLRNIGWLNFSESEIEEIKTAAQKVAEDRKKEKPQF
jgi:hypothetical protein